MSEPGGEVIVYRSPDGQSLVQLRAVAGTVWLAQAQIAALYDTSVPNIAQLIRRILDDGEVSTATINQFRNSPKLKTGSVHWPSPSARSCSLS